MALAYFGVNVQRHDCERGRDNRSAAFLFLFFFFFRSMSNESKTDGMIPTPMTTVRVASTMDCSRGLRHKRYSDHLPALKRLAISFACD